MTDRHQLMEQAVSCWLWIGRRMKRRPLTTLGVLLGCMFCLAGAAYIAHKADQANRRADEIQRAFCNSRSQPTPQIVSNCRALFDQLFRDPRPDQVERLRELVGQSP
jgi:hypothetical protein